MKKMNFDRWCRTEWLKFSLLITAVMEILILVNWNTWSTSLKCVAAIAALIPVHATEEWIFPGGFAYQYNTFLYKSQHPLCYPMNRASDMVTVLGTTIMYACLVLFFAVSGKVVLNGILLGAFCFSLLEISFHTYCGIRAFLKFKNKGKSTIYGTGSITAYVGFLPLAAMMLRQIMAQGVTLQDVGVGIAILGMTAFLCFVPEEKFKNEHSPYVYRTKGYYERYTRQ